MPHFSYDDDAPVDEEEVDPITFTLGGQNFECIPPPVPFGAITDVMRLVGAVGSDANMADPKVLMAVAGESHRLEEFLLAVLRDDDHDLDMGIASSEARFRALRHDKRARVHFSKLGTLVFDLVTEYTGRPTGAPSDSSPGRSTNGTTSKGAGASRERAPKASTGTRAVS